MKTIYWTFEHEASEIELQFERNNEFPTSMIYSLILKSGFFLI